jgi:hypothetical protein
MKMLNINPSTVPKCLMFSRSVFEADLTDTAARDGWLIESMVGQPLHQSSKGESCIRFVLPTHQEARLSSVQ